MFTIIGYHYAYIWSILLPMIKMLQHLVKNDTLTLVVTVGSRADIQHNEIHNSMHTRTLTCV